MDIFKISNIQIKSVIKVHNKSTGSRYMQYGDFSDFFQLIYVVNGEAEVVFNGTDIINKPGTIVFLPQGECRDYRAKILEDEDCFAIFFHADFPVLPKEAFHSFLKNTNILLMFEKMHRTWLKKDTGYYNKCISIFYSILAEMEFTISKYTPRRKTDKINNAVDYIHEHYTESDFPFNKLHTLCGISYTYFKKLFMERFFTTPSDYVRKLKIQHACELLITNNFSVTQVAHACGFSDVCYFSKVFKSETGVSPDTFRKSPK